MKLSLAPFDRATVSLVEKFCHWFQRMTGKTNYFLSRIMSLLFSASIVGTAFEAYTRDISTNSEAVKILNHPIISVLGLALYLSYAWWGGIKAEMRAFKRLEDGLANPMKESWYDRVFRILGLVSLLRSMFLFGIGWSLAFYFSIVAMLFLWACDPLPPSPGKIQEFIRGLFLKPSLAQIKR